MKQLRIILIITPFILDGNISAQAIRIKKTSCKTNNIQNKEKLSKSDTLVIIPPRICISEIEEHNKFQKVPDSIYCNSNNFVCQNKPEIIEYYKKSCLNWFKACLKPTVINYVSSVDTSDERVLYDQLKIIEKQLTDRSINNVKLPDLMLKILNKYAKDLCVLTEVVECSNIDNTFRPFSGDPVIYFFQLFILDIKKQNIFFYRSYLCHSGTTDYSRYKNQWVYLRSNTALLPLYSLLKHIKK